MNGINLDQFDRVSLGHTPTPLERAKRLGDALGIELWVKRDDCTGLACGGNKVRQLEFYLGRAVAAEADTVVITGAVQSNFVRLAAAAARTLGMDIHIQLEERVDHEDAAYRNSGNVLLDRLLGATLHTFPVGEDEAAADAQLEQIAASLEAQGRRPFVIHLGPDHPPYGALGYVAASQELISQWSTIHPSRPDVVVLASGSGQTHSGTLVGLRALGVDTQVVGVCVRRAANQQHPRIVKRATEVASMLGDGELVRQSDVVVDDTVYPPGYGRMSDAVHHAMVQAAQLEALLVDPVYTAKALAGLIHRVQSKAIAPGSKVVFLHTGGTPGLFGYETMITERLTEAV